MNKKFQAKEFEKMSNEELCAIALRLKSQLVEARFKMSSGEIEKVSVVKQIRKTIAKIFTELTNRGFKVSIGAHGVTMYDLKTNKPQSIDPKKLEELMNKDAGGKKAKATTTKEEPKAKEVKKTEVKVKEVKKGESK